ncbi:MAG TPA: site-specific DNA-methyltransferase [Anaerolineaceae bacterium]|nr:site-specific DNA-methyltransferase [Anaerolineaceae bacterium]
MTNNKRKRIGTKTSPFGTPGRENHDSSQFYSSRLYEGINIGDTDIDYFENPIPRERLNKFYCKSSEKMEELPDKSIHLMVTSPPYNASKEYDDDLNIKEYLKMLKRVWKETYRVLTPGGRACINLAGLGRRPYIPMHSYIIDQMIKIGFLMRGEIVWNKGASASASTAWGSWQSASNPSLRDVHEYILVFSKETFQRNREDKENTISREDFLGLTKSVWTFPATSARKVGHPAPFPEELPHRLIQLYSFKGDIVLDPFVGSGTTCIAAAADERYFIGYDINEKYLQLAEHRFTELLEKKRR